MTYIQNTSPRVIVYYGESMADLALMPTTTKIGEGEYTHAYAPEGSYAVILTDSEAKLFMLRSTGWIDITKTGGGGGGGTTNYEDLSNKPLINGITLRGDKRADDLGLLSSSNDFTATQIQQLIAILDE